MNFDEIHGFQGTRCSDHPKSRLHISEQLIPPRQWTFPKRLRKFETHEQDPEVQHSDLLFVKKKVDSSVWRRSWATGTVAAVFRSVFGVSFDL